MHDIEFWFDFSSPYAYFASLQIEAVADRHQRAVRWRPFLLGPAFRLTGMQPLTNTPLRGDYARRDWSRLARELRVPFALPEPHPIATLAPGRAFRGRHWRRRSRTSG
jgi:2-hydroxychromene-2-carboxylate isomerase